MVCNPNVSHVEIKNKKNMILKIGKERESNFQKSPDKINCYHNEYVKNKIKADMNFRLILVHAVECTMY